MLEWRKREGATFAIGNRIFIGELNIRVRRAEADLLMKIGKNFFIIVKYLFNIHNKKIPRIWPGREVLRGLNDDSYLSRALE